MKIPSTFRIRLREIAIRFIIAYPICFYLYGSAGIALVCMSHFINECIPMVLFSPMFMIMGPTKSPITVVTDDKTLARL